MQILKTSLGLVMVATVLVPFITVSTYAATIVAAAMIAP